MMKCRVLERYFIGYLIIIKIFYIFKLLLLLSGKVQFSFSLLLIMRVI